MTAQIDFSESCRVISRPDESVKELSLLLKLHQIYGI